MSGISGLGGVGGGVIPDPLDIPPETGTETEAPVQGSPPLPPQSPPLYLQSGAAQFSGQSTALRLGLAVPRGTFGDSEQLFAQIAAALKNLQSEAKDNDDFTKSSQRLGFAQRAATALQQLVTLNANVTGHEHNIINKQLRIEAIDAELEVLRPIRDALQAEVDHLESVVATYEGQIATLTTQITTLQGQINTLNGEIGTITGQVGTLDSEIGVLNGQLLGLGQTLGIYQTNLANAQNQQEIDFWTGQIATINGQITSTTATRDAKVGERDALITQRTQKETQRDGLVQTRDGKIGERADKTAELNAARAILDVKKEELAEVKAEITALEDERSAAVASIAHSQGQIGSLLGQMFGVIMGGFLFTIATQLQVRGDLTRDSFETREYDDSFEATLQQILAEVTKLVEEQVGFDFVEDNAMRGLGDPAAERGDRIAARFGALQPGQTLAMGFASGVAAVLGTLRQLLDQLDAAPKTAQTMADVAAGPRMRVAI